MATLDEAIVTDPNTSNRRRSERVMLQVPVVVQAKTRDGKDVQESTQTVVVNAHGGLLKLKMEIKAGQPIILINERAKLQQSCRVVRVETSEAGHSAVAFEFDQPSPHFWPIVFPPADWGSVPSR
jgi:PilZ domain